MPTLIKLKRSVTKTGTEHNNLTAAQLDNTLYAGEPFIDTKTGNLIIGKDDGETIRSHFPNISQTQGAVPDWNADLAYVAKNAYQPLVRGDEQPVVIGNTDSTLRVQKGENPIEGVIPIELVSDSRIVVKANGNSDVALYGESIYLCPKTPDMSDTYLSTLAVYDNRSNVVNVQINESYGLRLISQYSTNCVGEILLGNTGGITMRANTTNQSQGTTEVTIGDGQVMIGNGGLLVDGPSTIQGLAYVQSLKIGNSNIGSSSQPVYVNDGTITSLSQVYSMYVVCSVNVENSYHGFIVINIFSPSATYVPNSGDIYRGVVVGGIITASNDEYLHVLNGSYLSGQWTLAAMDSYASDSEIHSVDIPNNCVSAPINSISTGMFGV